MSTQMQSNTQDALFRIFELIREIIEKSADGSCIYRGEPEHYKDEKYNGKVSSTLYRMGPDGIDSGEFDLESLQKSILEEAKNYTHERAKENFELLTELQHYGSETNLIDFTTDYHVALFFACDGSHDKDGRIILLRRTGEVNKKYRVKEPWKPLNRVLAQKSIFVQPPNGFIDPDDFITVNVPANLKQWILIHLRKFQDISTESIYNDLHGYIKHRDRRSSREANLPRIFADYILEDIESGNISTEESPEQLQSAIEYCTTRIQYAPYEVETYVKQGKCYLLKTQFDCAIESFCKALMLEPDYAIAYSNRGTVYGRKGELDNAITDFDKAIELKPDYVAGMHIKKVNLTNRGTVYRGNAYYKKGELDNAITDFDKAIELKPDYVNAYNNRGRNLR